MSRFSPPNKPWTEEEDRKLRILWDAGWSTVAIGTVLERGKNAICARARRINLPMRGSPIPTQYCPDALYQYQRQLRAAEEEARQQIAKAA